MMARKDAVTHCWTFRGVRQTLRIRCKAPCRFIKRHTGTVMPSGFAETRVPAKGVIVMGKDSEDSPTPTLGRIRRLKA